VKVKITGGGGVLVENVVYFEETFEVFNRSISRSRSMAMTIYIVYSIYIDKYGVIEKRGKKENTGKTQGKRKYIYISSVYFG